MDRTEVMARLQSMTDEELLQLTEPHGSAEPRVRPSAVMPDGSRVEADSAEELNRLLVAKLGEYREREVEPEPEVKNSSPKLRKWDYKEFQKTFVEDPRQGMEYLEEVQTGIPGGYTKLVPMLVNAIGQLSTQVQELQAQDFLTTTPDYEPSPENRKVLDKIIVDRGWKVSNETLSDAFDIAKSRGLIRGSESRVERHEQSDFIPPRIKRGMGTEEEPATVEEIVNRAHEMPMKDLQKLLIAGGLLKAEHV